MGQINIVMSHVWDENSAVLWQTSATDVNRFVYSEGRVRDEGAEGGVCVPPPTPLARAHSSTPQDSPATPSTLLGSYVFVQRFLLFAAALVFLFFLFLFYIKTLRFSSYDKNES